MDSQSFSPTDYPIVLFDSQCLVCNSFVQWIIKKDSKQILKFSGLQSDKSQNEIIKRNIPIPEFDTVVLLYRDQYFIESNAIVEILEMTGQTVLGRLVEFFPKSWRDTFYRWFAHNRYRLYKKRDFCPAPDSSVVKRFI